MAKRYLFDEPLIEGLVKSRPNRFIMLVEVGGELVKCHCPATGRIGGIKFRDIPCLLSKAKPGGRKTGYTVEAISLNKPEAKRKSWIGINQNAANRYIEFFLKASRFKGMASGGKVLREVKLGNSRIDFKVGDTYVEVKTPLINLPFRKQLAYTKSKFDSFDRLIRHFDELGKSVGKHNKAVLLMCYIYNAKPFAPPEQNKTNSRIFESAMAANKRGVETWQANLKINKTGVELRDYFKLDLF